MIVVDYLSRRKPPALPIKGKKGKTPLFSRKALVYAVIYDASERGKRIDASYTRRRRDSSGENSHTIKMEESPHERGKAVKLGCRYSRLR